MDSPAQTSSTLTTPSPNSVVELATARKNLTELVKAVQSEGQHFTLTKYGKPVAMLVPIAKEQIPEHSKQTGVQRAEPDIDREASIAKAKKAQATRDALLRKK